MITVDDKALKGQFGEAYVSSILASECLVRQTTSLDIGVDLYCETIEQNQPFLHFWCQVKTGKIEVLEEGLSAKYSFKRKHLEYWDRQPVPVFAALVPTDWPVKEKPDVYIVDITSQRLTTKKPCTLQSDYVWKAGDRDMIHRFLSEIVPETTARLQLKNGVIAKIPRFEPIRVFHVASDLDVLKYQDALRTQIRRSAAWPIVYLHQRGELGKMKQDYRQRMKEILSYFTSGWDACFARGLLAHNEDLFAEAKHWYGISKGVLDRDEAFRQEIGQQETDKMYAMLMQYSDMACNSQKLKVVDQSKG